MREKINTQEIIKDYDRIYSTSGLKTNSAYYRWIIKLLKPKSSSRILDVSCGEGILLRELLSTKKGINAFGLDISTGAATIAKRNAPEAKILTGDGQRIPFQGGYFDYITCLGSLEHYLNPELGLKEIARVAKDEARFVIVLPNSISIDLFLEVLITGERAKDDFQIIERTATKNEWISLLTKNDFKIISVYGSNLWPELFKEGTYKIKSLKKYFSRLLIKMLCPVNLAREFVFICTRKDAR